MRRLFLGALSARLGLGLLLAAPQTAEAQRKAPPDGAYKKVSTLVQLPISCRGWEPYTQTLRHCPQARSSPTTARATW
jgi:hypothetical protein